MPALTHGSFRSKRSTLTGCTVTRHFASTVQPSTELVRPLIEAGAVFGCCEDVKWAHPHGSAILIADKHTRCIASIKSAF